MNRYALAIVLSALLGSSAFAQQPVITGPAPLAVGPPPNIAPHQAVQPGPTPTLGTPVRNTGQYGYYRSGGVLIGNNGVFPYDTGTYLVAGTDGLARSSGYFMMSPATGDYPETPTVPQGCGRTPRCFRR